MTVPAQVLVQGALDAVTVQSPASFSWYGVPTSELPPAAQRAMAGPAIRDYLRYQLQRRLYGDFYCKGSAVPADETPASLRSAATAPFVELLAAANTGSGTREPGWRVASVDGDAVTVERDGLRLWIGRQDTYADPADPIGPGQLRAIRFPKELLKLSPGFYMALGNEGLPTEPDRDVTRFYWNLRAEGAPVLVSRTTASLNADRIAFRLKVLNNPAQYNRCDAGVLYLQRSDYRRAVPIVRRIHVELGAHLKAATPAFTKALAPGLGLAEEPTISRDSFGLDRCRLLAEAIVRIHERGVTETDDRLAVVEEVFGEEGISLATPYLNPGSRDGYRF
jgi:hypothetical protein